MKNLFQSFYELRPASSATDFSATRLPGNRVDFIAKAEDGGPVFLLQDASPVSYSPAVFLKHLSVQFHNTCRVTTSDGVFEGQFAVISCDGSTEELHEIFVRCLAAAAEQLPVIADTSDLQGCLQALLDLFRTLSRPGGREVVGLWAELFVIAKSRRISHAMRSWHSGEFERFDFSWPNGCLEVKATCKEERVHDFSLEQLQVPHNGKGYIASLLVQTLSGGLGVMDLAHKIEEAILHEPLLREKLWRNIASALGADFSVEIDRKFDPSYAERNLKVFSMADVPAPDRPRDPRITALRFRVDLSSVNSSISSSPKSTIDSIFS
jgi:hypothetical protein